jgi:hypothetical protein
MTVPIAAQRLLGAAAGAQAGALDDPGGGAV